jgi:hypothetical protein
MNGTDSTHTMTPLLHDSTWIGPHVTFHCNWSDLIIPEFPTITIQQASIELLWVVPYHTFGTINHPVRGGWNPDYNPREAYAFIDLIAGQTVQIELEFGAWVAGEDSQLLHRVGDDLDIFVWPPDVEHTYANSITYGHYGNPEVASFRAPVNGTYTIGIDYYSGEIPMGWILDAYLFQTKGMSAEGQLCALDTSISGENRAYDVRVSFATGTNLDWDISFTSEFVFNVSVQNFIPPMITSLSPNGGEVFGLQPFLINWTATDANVDYGDEILWFSVEISNNAGVTWKVIEANTTLTSVLYDYTNPVSGLTPTNLCLVRVNATDGRYNVTRTSAAIFTIYIRPGGPPQFPYELFLIIVGVTTIGILVVILVLLLHMRRKSQSRKKMV